VFVALAVALPSVASLGRSWESLTQIGHEKGRPIRADPFCYLATYFLFLWHLTNLQLHEELFWILNCLLIFLTLSYGNLETRSFCSQKNTTDPRQLLEDLLQQKRFQQTHGTISTNATQCQSHHNLIPALLLSLIDLFATCENAGSTDFLG
jgi:hypothetical protein